MCSLWRVAVKKLKKIRINTLKRERIILERIILSYIISRI